MDADDAADAHRTLNVRAAYERALKELRQDAGCTKERLMQHTELLGVLQRRIQRAGKPISIEASLAELVQLVLNIGDPRHRDGLLVALRFDDQFQQTSLTERRTSYQQHLKNSNEPTLRDAYVDSLRTLERRENKAIRGLAEYLANHDTSEAPVRPVTPLSSNKADEIDSPSGIGTNAASFTYRFSHTGAMRHQEVERWLRATHNNTATSFSWTTKYFADRQRGVLSIKGDYGWQRSEVFELDDGSLDITFTLPRVLRPEDGLYPVGHHVTVNSEMPCSPMVYWEPVERAQEVNFRLIFHPDAKPVRAWWFIARSRGDGLREPAIADGRHLEIFNCADHHYMYKKFDDQAGLTPYRLHGVAWIWAHE